MPVIDRSLQALEIAEGGGCRLGRGIGAAVGGSHVGDIHFAPPSREAGNVVAQIARRALGRNNLFGIGE